MPDREIGDDASDTNLSSSFASSSSSFSSYYSAAGASTDDHAAKMEKDPRKIARRYQLELCEKAVEENVIVYLGTGCGKTHIAVMVIYELGPLILSPRKSVCIFLAPTVALVEQQALVIAKSINFKVATHCGGNRTVTTHSDWEREVSENEVLVMTPQILLHNLQHCFIRMEWISLLILDECHHAQEQSNHPYAQILKVFYKTEGVKGPRIFGMTASPVVGKGSFQSENLSKSINSLENLLNAKVYSVESNVQLDGFVSSPIVKVYYYQTGGSEASQSTNIYEKYENMLEDIKQGCLASLKQQIDTHQTQVLLNMKKLLKRTHDNLIYSLVNLGLWGAIQAARIQLNSDRNVHQEPLEENNKSKICITYLSLAAEVLSSKVAKDENASELISLPALKEPFFSRKLLQLIKILSAFRIEPHMKCIIFVNRIVTARTLSCILNSLKLLESWKSDFLVGLSSGVKSMSRKSMKTILERFQSKELNLLVATKVGEEGLDIQTCCLVIRFDLPETVTSFIQSRGRARMPKSEYAFLVDRGNEKEMDLIGNFKVNEDRMNLEITSRTSEETCPRLDDEVYRVHETGACISGGSSISLLYKYCSRLPHDEFFQPKPEFQFKPVDEFGGTICRITLPANAPISEIVSSLLPSIEAAKRNACLKAVYKLHSLGVLNNFLLPDSNEETEDELSDEEFDSDKVEGETCSRGELYEMIVPDLFKQKWDPSKSCVNLQSYYIRFVPHPADRIYKKFGLFMKSPLPIEAETMDFDLHLAHQRSVSVKIFPKGDANFDNDEIRLAERFQEVALKIIFERRELITEFVPLGLQDSFRTSKSTFYLLLPINLDDSESVLSVDWANIRSCLSSPIFKAPSGLVEDMDPPAGSHLKLANGCWSIDDVKNSVVFATHKKQFYFVTDICHGRNGFSAIRKSITETHLESIYNSYGVKLKHPLQPLLRLKPLSYVRNLLHNRKRENLAQDPALPEPVARSEPPCSTSGDVETHPPISQQQTPLESLHQSSLDLNDKKHNPLAKIGDLQVQFLRLVHRFGQSQNNILVSKVLYRVYLAMLIRAEESELKTVKLKQDKAKTLAKEQESSGVPELDFSIRILVLGKTGVGKSATINSIFGQSKSETDAFQPATDRIEEVNGTVNGVKVTFIDTPGLHQPSPSSARKNRKTLLSIKRYVKKRPPDVVLYLDRLDTIDLRYSDYPLLSLITETLGAALWLNTILVMTHSSVASEGRNMNYESYVGQRMDVVQHYIHQAVSDTKLENPVLLVENHPSCRKNHAGECVLPNGLVWKPQFMFLCVCTKVLGDVQSLLRFRDSIGLGQASGTRTASLPHLLSVFLRRRLSSGGDEAEREIDELMDSELEEEEEDEYDQLPAIRILGKTRFEKLSKSQKREYLDELDYRETLYLKKQLKEECRRRKDEKLNEEEEEKSDQAAVPLPEMAGPDSFDSDFPSHRYRSIASGDQWLVRPVYDPQGWDHDVGFDGINIETAVKVKKNLFASANGQVCRDKQRFTIHSETNAAYTTDSKLQTFSVAADVQSSGDDLVYTFHGGTKLKTFKHNTTDLGVGLTSFGGKYYLAGKIEDSLMVGKRVKLTVNAGQMNGSGGTAHGGSFEACIRGRDYPVRNEQIGVTVTALSFNKELVLNWGLQTQVRPSRDTNVDVSVNMNNRKMGKINVKLNSSEHWEIALISAFTLFKALIRRKKAVSEITNENEEEL